MELVRLCCVDGWVVVDAEWMRLRETGDAGNK